MANVNVKIIKDGVTHEGGPAAIDEVLELPELSGNALIAEGYAVLEGEQAPKEEEPPADDPDEVRERYRSGLDGQYTLDGGSKPSIRDAAQEAGVDFAFDAKKADIIQAVIDQGKAEALLQ